MSYSNVEQGIARAQKYNMTARFYNCTVTVRYNKRRQFYLVEHASGERHECATASAAATCVVRMAERHPET